MKTQCIEPLYYGRRLKATITTYLNSNNVRSYEVKLYKHKMEIYQQKLFFDNSIKSDDYKKQNDLYIKAHDYALNYLNNICVY